MAIRGELEILSLSGRLSVDATHLHLSRANRQHAVGDVSRLSSGEGRSNAGEGTEMLDRQKSPAGGRAWREGGNVLRPERIFPKRGWSY
jgi:hypothetical protein